VTYVPWKPRFVFAPGAIAALKLSLAAVTRLPDWVTVAFHALVTCWLPGQAHDSDQPFSAPAPELVMVTPAVNPVLQVFALDDPV
jgi:hypothetical protein